MFSCGELNHPANFYTPASHNCIHIRGHREAIKSVQPLLTSFVDFILLSLQSQNCAVNEETWKSYEVESRMSSHAGMQGPSTHCSLDPNKGLLDEIHPLGNALMHKGPHVNGTVSAGSLRALRNRAVEGKAVSRRHGGGGCLIKITVISYIVH